MWRNFQRQNPAQGPYEKNLAREVIFHDLASLLTVETFLIEKCIRADSSKDLFTLLTTHEKIMSLIEQLKRLIKSADAYPIQPLNLSERFKAINSTKRQLEQIFGLTIILTHDVSPQTHVYSNQYLASQITRNLISNAAAAHATLVEIHYQEEEYTVRITFKDNGKGMSKNEIHRLGFEERQGVKLIRKLVTQAGGTIRWNSAVGRGTKAIIRVRKVLFDDAYD